MNRSSSLGFRLAACWIGRGLKRTRSDARTAVEQYWSCVLRARESNERGNRRESWGELWVYIMDLVRSCDWDLGRNLFVFR